MDVLEFMKILVYATCMTLKIFSEFFGYWVGVACIISISHEITDKSIIVAGLIAIAWFFVSRLLMYRMEV